MKASELLNLAMENLARGKITVLVSDWPAKFQLPPGASDLLWVGREGVEASTRALEELDRCTPGGEPFSLWADGHQQDGVYLYNRKPDEIRLVMAKAAKRLSAAGD